MQMQKFVILVKTLVALQFLYINGALAVTPEEEEPTTNVLSSPNATDMQYENEAHMKTLSRKRRYLLFPEGSSFQVVYDGIYGIVDWTNYLILGITVALAWELPTKPPSEQLEDIEQHLADGTLLVPRNDTAKNITYVDTKPKAKSQPNYIKLKGTAKPGYNYYYANAFRPPMHRKYYYNPTGRHYYQPASSDWRRTDNAYYQNPYANWQHRTAYGLTPHQVARQYPWWHLAHRLSHALRKQSRPIGVATAAPGRPNSGRSHQQKQQQQQRQRAKPKAGYYQSSTPAPRKHFIYPVYGKRSVPDSSEQTDPAARHRHRRSGITAPGPQLSRVDRIHIRHHRSTRHELYERIEKYLDKLGHHGHHCVLRALCETGQKSGEREATTFVGELMRVVFTLPEPLQGEGEEQDRRGRTSGYKETRYDKAHAFAGNCAARYQRCKQSMWLADFVQ